MSKKFENLTKEIVQAVMNVSPNLQDAVIRDGPTNRIEGASGFKHQIDVSIEVPSEKLFLVECKHYKSKVTVSDMLVLIARIDDISKKKSIKVMGCFFTTKGYTEPARKVGSCYNIELNTFTDINSFAVHVAGNTFIKPAPIKIVTKISGGFLKDKDE
jgi:hypothetical protein